MKQNMESSYPSISKDDDKLSLLIPNGKETETTQVEPSAKKSVQFRLLLSAVILIILGVSASVTHFGRASVNRLSNCGPPSGFPWNQRSREQYSTLSPRAGLVNPGSKFVISPKDLFDTVIPDGESHFIEVKEQALSGELDAQHVAGIVGSEGLKDWAEKSLGNSVTRHAVISRPSMELPGKTLVVKSAKNLPLNGKLALAHQVEGNKYLCHVPKEGVTLIEITVAVSKMNGTNPMEHENEILYVACHIGLACHIMNVGDEVYGL